MNTDSLGRFIGLFGAMVLIGAALMARQRRGMLSWRVALIWVAIFAGLFAVAHWMDGRGQ